MLSKIHCSSLGKQNSQHWSFLFYIFSDESHYVPLHSGCPGTMCSQPVLWHHWEFADYAMFHKNTRLGCPLCLSERLSFWKGHPFVVQWLNISHQNPTYIRKVSLLRLTRHRSSRFTPPRFQHFLFRCMPSGEVHGVALFGISVSWCCISRKAKNSQSLKIPSYVPHQKSGCAHLVCYLWPYLAYCKPDWASTASLHNGSIFLQLTK